MKILVDARWVRTDHHDGISRYSTGIINGFVANNIPITLIIKSKDQLAVLPDGLDYIMLHDPTSPKELTTARKLNKLQPDVVYSPFQIMGARGRKYKLVLTLHDTIYYKYRRPPANAKGAVRVAWRLFHSSRWPQYLLLNRADHVMTVSEYSKKDITARKLTKRNISVAYNASGSRPQKNSTQTTQKIVYMGSFVPYKNVETLIRAMAHIPNTFELHLLSSISKKRQTQLEKIIPRNANVIFHNGVSEQDYEKILKQAFCLATASKDEGFGLPIVEAQNMGVPVICSDIEIFREVAGDSALFFDNKNPADFAKQVKQLQDLSLRQELIERGYQNTSRFTWEKSAADLYEVLKNLV